MQRCAFNKSCLHVVCLIACFAMGLAGGSSALACTSSTNVGTGGELASALGCFIEQSPPGDHEITVVQSISVRTDTLPSIDVFDESVGLTVKGGQTNAGAYTITGNGEEPVFRINGPASANFNDLTITHRNGGIAPGADGIQVNQGAGAVVISDVAVSNSDNGLSIMGGRVEFLNSYAFNNQLNGIEASGLTPGSSIAIDGSVISNNAGDGIWLDGYGAGMASVSNVFSHKNSKVGLRVTQSLGSEVASSDFNQNFDGGVSIENSEVSIRDSAFTASLASAGLHVVGAASKVTLVNSFSRYNRIGIQVSEATDYLLIDQSSLVNNSESGLVLTGNTPNALIVNSTLSTNGFNGSGDGIVINDGSVSIFGSLITANQGSGIVGSASAFKVKSSIVAGNNQAALGFQDCANGAQVVDLGANFAGDASCAGFSNDTDSYSLLGELEDNGCQSTAGFSSSQCVPTHALLAGNPAVAGGDCRAEPAASPPLQALLVDQRGQLRAVPCDAGPFEWVNTPPDGATLIAPLVASSSGLPSYRWTVVEDATWYQLYVNDESGNRYSRWMTAVYLGCADGASECDFSPATYSSTGASQLVGRVSWWVKTWNRDGHGPWSGAGVFTVGADVPPVAAALALPSGVTDANPAFLWQAVPNASWYYLWVEDEGAVVHRQWYTSVATGCASGDGACSITPGINTAKAGRWWVQTWNDAGYGPWSTGESFTIP